MAELFALTKKEDETRIHPHALKRLNEFKAEVLREVPEIGNLDIEQFNTDVNVYLDDSEIAKAKEYVSDITKWLVKCMDIGCGYLPYPYATWIFHSMYELKLLIKRAYKQKATKLAEEQRQKAALKAINPPFSDAHKYLDKDEYGQFQKCVLEAMDAYQPDVEANSLPFNYRWWLSVIKDRKERGIQRRQSRLEYEQFLARLDDTLKAFWEKLAKVRKPQFGYPVWLADYQPELWCTSVSLNETEVQNWAGPNIRKKVPPELNQFLLWNFTHEVVLLPYAKYELFGVPCLTWGFRTLILVKVDLELLETEFSRVFSGFEYGIKMKAEKLGSLYLGPVEWCRQEVFRTPIVLLSILAKGELEQPGITVIKHGSSFTTFKVQGFEGEVKIHDEFRKFIENMAKGQQLAEGLLTKGIIDKDTAKLIEAKRKQSLSSGSPETYLITTVDNNDVIDKLKDMGFKETEINEALNATELLTGMSLDEKVKTIVKNIDGKSR